MNKFICLILLASWALLTSGGILPEVYEPQVNLSVGERIVGGQKVDIKDYPYQVALFFLYNLYRCGGTIINERWVLSAALCTGFLDAEFFHIRAGSSHRDRNGVVYEMETIVIHPNYIQRRMDYNIALLRTIKPMDFNGEFPIRPISYQKTLEDIPVGEMLRISGWGATFLIEDDPTELRAVSVPKVDLELCANQMIGFPQNVRDHMICAGFPQGGADACGGDEGGPLVNQAGLLVGISSWGRGCAQPNAPGVYNRLGSFADWIDSIAIV